MLTLTHEISIGSHTLNGVESVVVQSSADLLSDQCTITLPSTVLNKPFELEGLFRRGDPVTVKLGYDEANRVEFSGYLKTIGQGDPAKLECEDAAYLLRRPVPDKVWKKTDAGAILKWTIAEVNKSLSGEQQLTVVTDIAGLQFDSFSTVRANGYEVLEKLKSESGVTIYCRGNEVHMHLAYTEKRGEVTYSFQKNIRASTDLTYVVGADQQLSLVVVGRKNGKKKNEVTVGDKGGDKRTILRPNVSNKATLERIGKQELDRLKHRAAYKGAVKSYLVPVCEVGYTVVISDTDYPAREGRYYASSVKTEFGKGGGIRTVTLGIPLSDTATQPNTIL